MSLRKLLTLVFPLAVLACLASGFLLVRQWLALAGLLLVLAAWLLAWRKPSRWSSLAALVLSVGFCAAGILLGASAVLMILGAACSLAAWDLSLWALSLVGVSPAEPPVAIAHNHYISLIFVLALSLLVALAGRLLRLQLPFGLMAILVLLVLFSLERLWHHLAG